MNVLPPTLGPIVGYTTAQQARVWLRAEFESSPASYRRAFAVARCRKKTAAGTKKFNPPLFVKAPPYFDMTGVVVFSGLVAETEYEYQAGWFFTEAELEDVERLDANSLDWTRAFTGSFRTGSERKTTARTYVIGSCRYLLRLFGGTIFDERGDKAFGSVLAQLRDGQQTDGLIMMGDQIYADDLNIVSPDTTVDEFLTRYRTVFSQPYVRQLMSQVPTYMILDDHEIEDNWPMNASEKDWVTRYPAAIHSYQIYQCSHSPLFAVGTDGRITGTLTRFWYQFQDGCSEWFVMDCRNERVWDEKNPSRNRMISDTQMEALLDWLNDDTGRVKLVITSVPFFPDLKEESDDKWSGFVRERARILDHILTNNIRRVVFLSGDVHCSFSVELASPNDPDFQVLSVVSSSFFWPYPHMSANGFELTKPLAGTGTNTYVVGDPSEVHSIDNFTRLSISPDAIEVATFDRKGKRLAAPVRRAFRL